MTVVGFPTPKEPSKRLDEINFSGDELNGPVEVHQKWDPTLGMPHGGVGDGKEPRWPESEVNPSGTIKPWPRETNDLARYKDKINPDHYRKLPMEAIEITEHFNFCLGNALKYIIRCEHKGDKKSDLAKAIWYLQRELARS